MKKNLGAKNVDIEMDMFVISVGKKHTKNSMKGRKKKMAKTVSEAQKRAKIIEKLISLGITTEEQIKKLTPAELTTDKNITFADILLICELQECVKNNKVFSFLAKKEG